MRSNGYSTKLSRNIFVAEDCPNIDYKYGPYNSTQEAFDQLCITGGICIGLTVGILQQDGSIQEYWFKSACNTANDLVLKNSDSSTSVVPNYTDSTGGSLIATINNVPIYDSPNSGGGDTTVEPIYNDGVAIATVNGTTIYAPASSGTVQITQSFGNSVSADKKLEIGKINTTSLYAPKLVTVTNWSDATEIASFYDDSGQKIIYSPKTSIKLNGGIYNLQYNASNLGLSINSNNNTLTISSGSTSDTYILTKTVNYCYYYAGDEQDEYIDSPEMFGLSTRVNIIDVSVAGQTVKGTQPTQLFDESSTKRTICFAVPVSYTLNKFNQIYGLAGEYDRKYAGVIYYSGIPFQIYYYTQRGYITNNQFQLIFSE